MHSGPIKDMFAKAVMLFIDTKASKWWDIDGNYSFYRFEDLSLLQRILSKYALEKPECRNNFQNLLSEISSNSLFSSKISISSVDPKINFEKSSYAAVLNGLLSIAEVERTIIGHQSCSLLRKEAKKVIDSLVSLPPAQMEEAALIEILNLLRHFDLMTDVQKYSKRLTVKNDSIITQEFLTLTSANKKWAKSQFSINTIKNITQGSKNLTIIGVSVWGVEFINFFCDFYLPSILQNIEKRNIEQTYILSIVTDSTSRLFIENQKIFENLKKNIIIRFTETKISMSISGVMPFYKYLGLLDHQHIYLARELKANLILIPPDCVFGESSFKEIHKLLKDFECVTASCLEASKNQIIESLKCYINNSKLKISASELLNLAAKYK